MVKCSMTETLAICTSVINNLDQGYFCTMFGAKALWWTDYLRATLLKLCLVVYQCTYICNKQWLADSWSSSRHTWWSWTESVPVWASWFLQSVAFNEIVCLLIKVLPGWRKMTDRRTAAVLHRLCHYTHNVEYSDQLQHWYWRVLTSHYVLIINAIITDKAEKCLYLFILFIANENSFHH